MGAAHRAEEVHRPDMRRKERSDEGSSIVTGYVVNLGIATVMVAMILFMMQGIFTDIFNAASESQIRVAGESISSDIQKADRLAVMSEGDGPSVKVTPPRLGQDYSVTIRYNDSADRGFVHLVSGNTNIRIPYTNQTPIQGVNQGIDVPTSSSVTISEDSGELVIER